MRVHIGFIYLFIWPCVHLQGFSTPGNKWEKWLPSRNKYYSVFTLYIWSTGFIEVKDMLDVRGMECIALSFVPTTGRPTGFILGFSVLPFCMTIHHSSTFLGISLMSNLIWLSLSPFMKHFPSFYGLCILLLWKFLSWHFLLRGFFSFCLSSQAVGFLWPTPTQPVVRGNNVGLQNRLYYKHKQWEILVS